jgi:uncharacterized membrane protein (DUF485 family)
MVLLDVGTAISLAIFFEVITTFLRFGLKLESRRLQLKKMHFPFRVHHMYLALIFLFLAPFYEPAFLATLSSYTYGLSIGFLEIGIGLILSDLFHHFVMLPSFHKAMDFP